MDLLNFDIFSSIMLSFFCIDTMMTKTILLATLSHPSTVQHKVLLDAIYGYTLGGLEASFGLFARRKVEPK